MLDFISDVFVVLFSIYALYKIFLFMKYLFNLIVLPLFWTPINFKDFGQWAVVTGCTDGIGKGFTLELAKRGMDMILISRSRKKLEDLAEEISNEYNVKTKIIVADFTKNSEVIPEISKQLDNMDIGLLFNNVGISLGFGNFLTQKMSDLNNLIEVNIKTAVYMTSIVMKNMVYKRRGIIINSSSVLATLPCPGGSAYGGTKAFMHKFSTDLHDEYKKYGIHIHCLTTGSVRTKMFGINISDWATPLPRRYAESALKTIGMTKVTTGYSAHDLTDVRHNRNTRFCQSSRALIPVQSPVADIDDIFKELVKGLKHEELCGANLIGEISESFLSWLVTYVVGVCDAQGLVKPTA